MTAHKTPERRNPNREAPPPDAGSSTRSERNRGPAHHLLSPPPTRSQDAALRRRQSVILLAFGALATVMANRYQPRFLFFQVHAFHVALLFFAVGHHGATVLGTSARDKLRLLAGDARGRLGTFYGFGAVVAGVTMLLAAAGLSPGGEVPRFDSAQAALASAATFLVGPLVGTGRYELFATGWLLPQLFLVAALFQFACGSGRSRIWLFIVAAIAAATAAISFDDSSGTTAGAQLVVARTAFTLLFFVLGYIVRTLSPAVKRRLTAPVTLVAAFLAADALSAAAGSIAYDLERGIIGNSNPVVRLLSTTAILLLLYALSHYLARIVGARSWLLRIGDHWMAILVACPGVLFGFNLVLHATGLVTAEELATPGFALAANKTWLLYLIPAVALPLLGALAVTRLARKPRAEAEAPLP